MGDSAGGNLVITSMLKLLEDSKTLPGAGICFSPWLNLSPEISGSMLHNSPVDILNVGFVPTVLNRYLGRDFASLVNNPLVSPVTSKQLNDLPPLFISAGTSEALLDNALDFSTIAALQGNKNVAVHLTPYGYHCNFCFALHEQPAAVNLFKDVRNWLSCLYPDSISRTAESNPVHQFLHNAFNP